MTKKFHPEGKTSRYTLWRRSKPYNWRRPSVWRLKDWSDTCEIEEDGTFAAQELGICGGDVVCATSSPHLLHPLLCHHTDLAFHRHLNHSQSIKPEFHMRQ